MIVHTKTNTKNFLSIMKLIYLPRKSCVGDNKSVNWIKIMDSAKLAAATFLIYLFVKGMFTFASML